MKYFTAILVLSSFFFSVNAGWFFGSSKPGEVDEADTETEDPLRVTFGPIVGVASWLLEWIKPLRGFFTNKPFAKMPLNVEAAKEKKFVSLSDECSSKDFQGYRYAEKKNGDVVLLYDASHHIAGIQTRYAINQIPTGDDDLKKWFERNTMFTKEGTDDDSFYTATVYFKHPDHICSKKRALERAAKKELEIEMYIKDGKGIVPVPTEETKLDSKWTEGECFPLMGKHYWYDTSKDMDCLNIKPYFLLYWEGKLNGFGFVAFGDFKSKRFEHPPSDIFPFFMKTVPECMKKKTVSTMHVYFNSPLNKLCMPPIHLMKFW